MPNTQTRNEYLVELHVTHRKTLAAAGEIVGITRERARQIVRAAGVPPEVTWDVRRENTERRETFVCEQCGKEEEMRRSHADERRFCSHECHDIFRSLTDDDLLEVLRNLAERLGRTPTTEDVCDLTPHSHKIFYERFGSFRKAQRKAGLKPNKLGGNRQPEKVRAGV